MGIKITHYAAVLDLFILRPAIKPVNVTAGLAIYGHVAQNERDKAQKEVDKWVK